MRNRMYFGNENILNTSKITFLCSRQVTASTIIKCYDWANEQRAIGQCVICGNHSQLEKDVFDILLRGNQPLILVLARGMMSRWDNRIAKEVEAKRLLVISPFEASEKRVTKDKAYLRNKYMVELADQVVVGYIHSGGQLEKLLKNNRYNSV